jgi:prepilin-type N-terminal cleavage/methylation domain-containing protein
MIKRTNSGFTLIELLVVMTILGFVLAATTDTFVGLLRGYKQQSKIAETNIEGIIGLELMRQDIERAGFGLPWVIRSVYQEAASAPASFYNDSPNPPRPILNGYDGWVYGGSGPASSDYLVIKATNIARNNASQLWTLMTTKISSTIGGINSWSPASENPQPTDYVIVLSPGTGNGDVRSLVSTGLTYSTISTPNSNDPQPQLIFGISPDTAPRMPFNRADYMILGPGQTTDKIPARCAPNSGVLVKKVVNQSDGLNSTEILPLLDCAADMKVIFRLDTDGDGTIDTVTDNLNALSAQNIRKQVKEIRVYILAHEGQQDAGFTYPATTIHVGDTSIDSGLGHTYNIGTNVHYRWKLYTIVVQPKNLGQKYGDNG